MWKMNLKSWTAKDVSSTSKMYFHLTDSKKFTLSTLTITTIRKTNGIGITFPVKIYPRLFIINAEKNTSENKSV